MQDTTPSPKPDKQVVPFQQGGHNHHLTPFRTAQEKPMTRLFNEPSAFADEMIEGFVA